MNTTRNLEYTKFQGQKQIGSRTGQKWSAAAQAHFDAGVARRKARLHSAVGSAFNGSLESLEDRRLMSTTTLIDGMLTVTGDANSSNVIVVKRLGKSSL